MNLAALGGVDKKRGKGKTIDGPLASLLPLALTEFIGERLTLWLQLSAQIMGHKPSAIAEKHYRKRPIDLLRMWHEKIEAWVLEQAGIDFKQQENSQSLRAIK